MIESKVYELTAPFTLVQKRDEMDDSRLGEYEVLAKTKYTAVSTGTEMGAWLGLPPLRPSNAYPRLVGYCNIATVIKVGAGVEDIVPGDSILTHQSHRTAFICNKEDVLRRFRSVSESLLKKLSATYLYHLGYSALLKANFRPGHQVAIIGAGAIGIATASLVKLFGLQPFIFTNQKLPREFTRVFGKDKVDLVAIQSLCDMDGVDIVINTSNDWSDYQLGLSLVRRGGEIILVGFPGRGQGLAAFNPLDSQYLYDKQLTIKQCGYTSNINVPPIDGRFTIKRNLQYLSELILEGLLDPNLILNAESRWADLELVYREIEGKQTSIISVLINWGN